MATILPRRGQSGASVYATAGISHHRRRSSPSGACSVSPPVLAASLHSLSSSCELSAGSQRVPWLQGECLRDVEVVLAFFSESRTDFLDEALVALPQVPCTVIV